MSVSGDSNGQPSSPQEAASLLSNLPRTRPQRSTPRRTAARNAKTEATSQAAPPASSNGAAPASSRRAKRETTKRTAKGAEPVKPVPARRSKPKARTASPRTAAARVVEPVPLQGFESESDHAHGAVHPPSGTEMVVSATEMLGELAKAGFSMGERLLKDALSRLPLS